jgi:hypothetical protein
MANNLAKATSVLSMAAGGLYIAKGVEELQCCSAGCTGSGAASQKAKSDITEKSIESGKKINPAPRAPDFWKLRFPTEACNGASGARGVLLLVDFFRPTKAEALFGCLDAMLALATGGLMLLQGMMGMQAAMQAGKNAEHSLGNLGNLNSYAADYGPSPTPDSRGGPGSSDLGGSGRIGHRW